MLNEKIKDDALLAEKLFNKAELKKIATIDGRRKSRKAPACHPWRQYKVRYTQSV